MKSRKVGIQYFRAFACVAVFLSHLLGSLPNGVMLGNVDLNETPLRLLWGGYVGVIIFFALSGFWGYKEDERLSFSSYCKAVIKRHLRIYPAYLLVLLIALAARATCPGFAASSVSSWSTVFWQEELSLRQLVMAVFLVSPFNADLLNPVVWTLRVELRMCFFLPLVSWAIKKFHPLVVIGLSIALGFAIPTFAYLPVFVLGMYASRYKEKLLKVLFGGGQALLDVFSVLLLDSSYIASWLGINLPAVAANIITTVGALLLILRLYPVKEPKNHIGRWLVHVGDLSYYVYLVHMVVLLWLRFLVEEAGFGVYTAVTILVSCGLAEMVYYFDRWSAKRLARFYQRL